MDKSEPEWSTWKTVAVVLLVIFVILPLVTGLIGLLILTIGAYQVTDTIVDGIMTPAAKTEPFAPGYKTSELSPYPNLSAMGANLAQRLYSST